MKKKKRNRKNNKVQKKTKKSEKWPLIFATITFVLIAILIVRNFIAVNQEPVETENYSVQSIDYYYRYANNEGFCHITLEDDSLKIKQREGSGAATETETTNISDNVHRSLDSVADDYGVKTWTNLAQTGYDDETGENKTFKIVFTDGYTVDIDSNTQLPENGWKAIETFVSILREAVE